MDDQIPVVGFIKNTLIEWEGEIASVVLVPFCNFRCHYCHSHNLVRGGLDQIDKQEIFDYLEEMEDWVTGVVISGGEPTMFPAFRILNFISNFKAPVKLDTDGAYPWVIEDLLVHTDQIKKICMDVKAPFDKESYRKVIGFDSPLNIDSVKETANILIRCGVEHEFRTTVCPEFHKMKDIVEIAKSIEGADEYVLQRFRPGDCLNPEFNEKETYSFDDLRRFAEAAGEYVRCRVRGDSDDE